MPIASRCKECGVDLVSVSRTKFLPVNGEPGEANWSYHQQKVKNKLCWQCHQSAKNEARLQTRCYLTRQRQADAEQSKRNAKAVVSDITKGMFEGLNYPD